MDLQLSGKTAIVTGATAGIGLAIATTLAREGVSVTITGRGGDKLDAAVQRIAAAAPGSQVTAVVADQSSAEGAARLIEAQPDTDIEAHFFQTYRPNSLIARMIEADEIAAMVALLASPLGAASNGAAVRVEGSSFRSIL